MIIDSTMIGRRVIVKISKDSAPEVWTVVAVRISEVFGKFIEFIDEIGMNWTVKVSSLYDIKFV